MSTTFNAVETHPLDAAQPAGTLLPSQGVCSGDFESLEAGGISLIPIPAIGLVHTGCFAPTIKLVEKKKARIRPKPRVCTIWE